LCVGVGGGHLWAEGEGVCLRGRVPWPGVLPPRLQALAAGCEFVVPEGGVEKKATVLLLAGASEEVHTRPSL
jgi:hypothetical protein